MGVRAGCKPRDDVLQGELDDAIFAASFGKLIRDEGPLIYRNADLFFRNTHPTASLAKLCRDVFGRLSASDEAGAILRLSTGFGGGKTHALMTLWHLAKNIADPTLGNGPAAARRSAGACPCHRYRRGGGGLPSVRAARRSGGPQSGGRVGFPDGRCQCSERSRPGQRRGRITRIQRRLRPCCPTSRF